MTIKQLNMFAEKDDTELILTYVPEAEYLSFDEALKLAEDRDLTAAILLANDYWRDLMWRNYGKED